MKAGKISTSVLIVLFIAVTFIAYILYQAVAKPVVAPRVNCAPYLAQVYGLEGEPANISIVIKDSIDKDPVSGANLYLFEEKPYYWDKTNKFTYIGSMISGKTPVGTSDTNGKLYFTVPVPYVDEGTKVYYGVLTATGFWSDLYTVKVGFSSALTAASKDECVKVYKKTDVTAAVLVDVSLTRVLDGKVMKLSEVLMDKIGTLDYDSTESLGVSEDATAKEMTKTINLFVSEGYARVDAIEFKRLLTDLTSEGIKRIEVEVKKGSTVLLKEVLFDEMDSESPLAKDDTKAYNKIGDKDLIVIGPGEGLTVSLKVIADTEATASSGSGRLGPGEQFLQVNIKFAHPQETSPATITVQG